VQKQSFLFLLILLGVALIGAYQAFVPAQGGIPQATIRFLAISSFFLLSVSLMIGPLAVLWPQKFTALIEPRRAIGIAAFAFGALHILLVLMLYFNWDLFAPFAFFQNQLAGPATVIMLLLTLTACDFALNKLGMGTWKTIQRLAYIAFALLFAHFVSLANGLLAGNAPTNLSEFVLALLGIAVIILQIAGFVTFRKRQSANKAASAPQKNE
jgi:DMSO/TMAO reductase YedYZ heme-binding membrane subunit